MDLFEKTVEQEYKYKGRILNLRVDKVELPDGHQSTREFVEHNGGVVVAALTDEGELLFVRQFRYPYGEPVLELPAGKLEKGEDPFRAGVRELKEETGAVAGKYIDLGKFYPSPGYTNEVIYLYGAMDLHFEDQQLDEGEFLDVERIPLSSAVEMVLNNDLVDGKSQAAILKLQMRKWYEEVQ